ncbi:unnamed protein product [Kuraishia capsulata CBS 1993]|uniref:PIN domain-containing protein n=1 Tax=Kuraishia capsulata CBS 1993 TaxID=1382522 RepID=W6MNN1_9ASCO|nr:uncharacterized protein KUCA_T00004223001 [Kuraishia capsulata CBS 1993]CDK28241.1 unnamed protein product [Kuraishia capsulata CBS 1993]
MSSNANKPFGSHQQFNVSQPMELSISGSPEIDPNTPQHHQPLQSLQQKRQYSQSYILPGGAKRGAISSNAQDSATVPILQSVVGDHPSLVQQTPQKKATIAAVKTPTPSLLTGEVPASPNMVGSPKLKSIARIFETEGSVGASSDMNDLPATGQSPDSAPEQQSEANSHDIAIDQKTEASEDQQSSTSEPSKATEEEQYLFSRLQEPFREIVKLEVECRNGCFDLNKKLLEGEVGPGVITPQIWNAYKNISTLLDLYYEILTSCLRPPLSKTGKQLITNYKIPRRLWVYGVVAFLEVLKNVSSVFIDHEICSCFISRSFNIISCLTDSAFGMEGYWAERLGDLCRMAIALYPSRHIDWKVAAKYWFDVAARTQFGHGKIYFHMASVETDSLEALVSLAKSVACRDAFAPSPQYLYGLIETAGNQRNILATIEVAMIDFVRIHKILLMHNEHRDAAAVITNFSNNFGLDGNRVDFFAFHGSTPMFPPEKLTFWYQKGPNFAICNITHLIGFGDSRNPLAKLFGLPEALKERKDKRERKSKAKAPETGTDPNNVTADVETNGVELLCADELTEEKWFTLIPFINTGSIELSMKMLKKYITGPWQSSTPHVIVWLYFLISLGEGVKKHPTSKPMVTYFVKKFFPWMSLVRYLNDILFQVRSDKKALDLLMTYSNRYFEVQHGDVLSYFSKNERLFEVWKSWGTLWFDHVHFKGDYAYVSETGAKPELFDLPTSGPRYDGKEDVHRFVRIMVLANTIADYYDFGLIRKGNQYRYSDAVAPFLQEEETAKQTLFYYLRDPKFESVIEKPQPELVASGLNEPLDVGSWCTPVSVWDTPDPRLHSEGFMDSLTPMRERHDSSLDLEIDENIDLLYAADAEADDSDDVKEENEYMCSISHPISTKLAGDLGERMDTSVTWISLDTNTWLKHCGRLYNCIRNDVFKLSIPLAVFQELRSLRRSQDALVSDSATRAVITVRQLYSEKNIYALRADGTRASNLHETTEFENNSTWRSNTEEIILNAVKKSNEHGRDERTGAGCRINKNNKILSADEAATFCYNALVTDDQNMRLRSRVLGMTSYQSKWLFYHVERVAQGRCTD